MVEAQSAATDPPVVAKADFIQNFQANFGTITLPGCGLHLDNLFDPFLLIAWVENRACFESMMAEHARRNDNVVAVDPRSGYHGHNDVDLWHEPERFAAFLRDVRRHTNARGEHFRTLVFFAGDSHIDDLRAPAAYAHWQKDLERMAAVAAPVIDATVPCWECRPQDDYVSAETYIAMGRQLALAFPRAVHAHHFAAGAVAWVGDDQAAAAWRSCRAEGWCDLLLYQFEPGDGYLHPEEAADNGTGHPGVLGRWYEVVVRLGDDPWSAATAGGDRHGWVQAPVVAFEFIYDTYWSRDPRATEAYATEFCRKALALGGWGCGSASFRRSP